MIGQQDDGVPPLHRRYRGVSRTVEKLAEFVIYPERTCRRRPAPAPAPLLCRARPQKTARETTGTRVLRPAGSSARGGNAIQGSSARGEVPGRDEAAQSALCLIVLTTHSDGGGACGETGGGQESGRSDTD